MTNLYRIERDSLGEVQVPAEALYGVQKPERAASISRFPGCAPGGRSSGRWRRSNAPPPR